MNAPDTRNSNSSHPLIDYTNKDYASLREAMLALGRERLPEWTDQSANDPGVVLVELLAYMGDILLYYQDRLANESYLDTAVERRSVMNLLRLIGCELRPPRPASADLTLLFGIAARGNLTIETDTEFKATTKSSKNSISFRYVRQPLTVDLESLGITNYKGKDYKSLVLPVMQVDSVFRNVPIGSSDGSPSQRFALAQQPLIDESLDIRVDGRLWQRKETLLYSYSNDPHFVLRRDEDDSAWIQFGDGKFGRIPPAGQNNITATYRIGGGTRGNVPPYTITEMVTRIGDSDDNSPQRVVNISAATGGAEHEGIASAVLRGPQLFRARSRAVTAEDYEAFAREFGVGKVKAQAHGWSIVELYVAPIGGGYPTDTLKEELRLYFEDKRMLTSTVEVKNPTYVPVVVEGDLYIERTYLKDQVEQRARDAVRQLLSFDHVDFGDHLYVSKFYEVIEDIEGVAGVNITKVAREGQVTEDLPRSGVLAFFPHEIPQSASAIGIKLNIIHGGPRAR